MFDRIVEIHIMKLRIFKMYGIFLLLVASCALLFDGVASKKSGFPFPPNLIGTNYTAMGELEVYKKRYNPIDLGIDLFDGDAPENIRIALANASLNDPASNQYAPNDGTLRLRTAIANLYSRLIGQQLNPEENVLITVGATEAMHSAIAGHTLPGDEWIIIEPAYIIYQPQIRMAHGIPRFTALKLNQISGGTVSGDDWQLDRKEFESLFNENTKGIILNNPTNPIGKVYTIEELQFVANLAKKYDVLVICDEAHEWVAHKPHHRIASLPGMYERTITVGSASKSFSLAGWRIGWAYGHKDILNHVKTVHMNNVDSAAGPQQEAIAFAFEEEIRNMRSPNSFFVSHERDVQRQSDILVKAMVEAGFEPVITSGGFCMLVNWTSVKNKIPQISKSMDFVVWMIKNVGILGLPGTSYFGDEHKYIGQDYARFCFHKNNDTLEEATRRLKKVKSLLKNRC